MSFQAVKLHHHRHVGARPCYLYPSSLEHNSNCVLSLHRAFHIMLVVLKGNLNSKLAVLFVIPTTSCFIIPLLDVVADRLFLREASRQRCRDHHQHPELLQGIDRMHDEKYHPCTLDGLHYHRHHCLPSLQHKRVHVLCCSSSSLLIHLMSPSTLEYYYLFCQGCRETCNTS